MNIYPKTRKSHYWNEDRFIIGKNYAVVIDGATPLKKSRSFNEANWMVDYIKKHFNRYKGCVKNRLERLSEDVYRELALKTYDEDYLPSASACWIEFSNSKLTIGILGDCEVTAISKEGLISRFFDDRLEILDKKAIAEMVDIAKEKNIHINTARQYIEETLVKHRKLANKPQGYPALLPSPKAKINEKKYEIETGNLKTVYLYSDGFSQAFNNLKIYSSHTEMFKKITDVDEEIKKIKDVSFSDGRYDLYPRFKKIDDITVVKVDF